MAQHLVRITALAWHTDWPYWIQMISPTRLLSFSSQPMKRPVWLVQLHLKQIISLGILIAPNGVQSMSMDLDNLVESSLNLGVLEQSDKSIRLTISVRSCVNSIREGITRGLEALAKQVNAKSSRTGEYPAWRYEPDSKIRDLCVSFYKEVSGKDAVVRAIHAGLERGLLKEKLPKTDMISFGPNLYNVHTPAEYLSISSVSNMWAFLKAVLAKLK